WHAYGSAMPRSIHMQSATATYRISWVLFMQMVPLINLMCRGVFLVMLAKAGIQLDRLKLFWILAFAGMTAYFAETPRHLN
ncbi:MAG: hypothetical protein JSV83_03725, partial [Desulfobacterales bacterium]